MEVIEVAILVIMVLVTIGGTSIMLDRDDREDV